MKAHTVKKNSSGNCFLGGWCAGGYRMQSIGAPSMENFQRKFLSCHSDQKSVLTIRLGLIFLFISTGLEAYEGTHRKEKQFGELFFRWVVRRRVPNAKHWVAKQCRLPKARYVLSDAPKFQTRYLLCWGFFYFTFCRSKSVL